MHGKVVAPLTRPPKRAKSHLPSPFFGGSPGADPRSRGGREILKRPGRSPSPRTADPEAPPGRLPVGISLQAVPVRSPYALPLRIHSCVQRSVAPWDSVEQPFNEDGERATIRRKALLPSLFPG